MPKHEFEFHLAPFASRSQILMDGEPLQGVTAVTVTARVGELTTATVEFVGGTVKVFTTLDEPEP